MIEAIHLTKTYQKQTAVSNITFTVEDHQVVGLVGPNGAGKSSTMNMLTGFISATEGRILVDGIDLFEEPSKAKAHIGYAPENPPLYLDMTVNEYLSFCFELKKVKLPKKDHIAEICEKVKIVDVCQRLLKNLSRGYKQRVGIAQALIGYPNVLILDEPTVGLDPRQMIEMRKLIGELGKEHSILLSSHILPEIQSVCDKVLLLKKGRMVGFGTPQELSRRKGGRAGLTIRVEGGGKKVAALLKRLEEVEEVKALGEKEAGSRDFLIFPADGQDVRKDVSKTLSSAGIILLEMKVEDQSLEETFLKAMGDLPRDAQEESQEERFANKPPAKYKKARDRRRKK